MTIEKHLTITLFQTQKAVKDKIPNIRNKVLQTIYDKRRRRLIVFRSRGLMLMSMVKLCWDHDVFINERCQASSKERTNPVVDPMVPPT